MNDPSRTGWAERPENKQFDVAEGEYLPPGQNRQQAQTRAKGAGAILVAIGALLAKFKGVLLILLNLKWFAIGLKLFWFAGSFVASVWFYALFWGWKFGLIFVVLIGIHEFGHWLTMRFYGVPSTLPFFIPGMGALVNMKGRPPSAFHESLIAFAGPLTGTLASAACAYVGVESHQAFWLAAAYLGFFLNLFNLAPVMPLDGGRVVGSISPRIWVVGLAVFLAAMFYFRMNNPLIWILVLLSLPQVWAAWKGRLDPQYYGITLGQRLTITTMYFCLAAVLFIGMIYTRVPVVGHHVIAQ